MDIPEINWNFPFSNLLGEHAKVGGLHKSQVRTRKCEHFNFLYKSLQGASVECNI